MIRKMIEIDAEKCNGCGACVKACHEGALDIIEGKARLAREDYCDGLGACLPECPTGAITFKEREVPAYVEASPQAARWPFQMKLVPVSAPYYKGAELLIAADCTAYAYRNIHDDYMKDRITLIGCPKLDAVDYSAKLTEILKFNDVKGVTLVRMEVPCCGGLEIAAKKAVQDSGKPIPLKVIILSIDGRVL